MYTLKNWYLKSWGEKHVVAWGSVYDNPRFCQGTFIHTSSIEKVVFEEDKEQLIIITRSQSSYVLSFSEINIDALENTRACISTLNIPKELIEKCVEYSNKRKAEEVAEVSAKLQPKELYLIMAGLGIISAYFKKANGEVVEPHIKYHTGMFQDSVLIVYSGEIDFRFFPKGIFDKEIEPYHWSNGLKQITIHNIGDKFVFRGSDKKFTCHKDETITVTSDDYTGEGLVSPDCVDDKSAFLTITEEVDSE